MGYKCRWCQAGFSGTTTGDVVYRDLNECLALCLRVNKKWGPSGIQQWPVAFSLMQGKGEVTDHAILANAVGEGCGFGPNVGRIKPMPMTFGSLLTEAGTLKFYLGEGEFTDDPVPAEFFGCAGVAAFDRLQDVLLHVGRNGYRHHVSVAPGHHLSAVYEALTNYLGWEVSVPQKETGWA